MDQVHKTSQILLPFTIALTLNSLKISSDKKPYSYSE